MARFYFERWSVHSSPRYEEGPQYDNMSGTGSGIPRRSGYDSYAFSSVTGFSGVGEYRTVDYGSTYTMLNGGLTLHYEYYRDTGSNTFSFSEYKRDALVTHYIYSKGTYVDTIIAEDGTYPDNGRVGTTYWYVKIGRAFPELAVKADGQVKQGIDGWVKVGGELKRIVQMWTKTGGQLKES